MKIVVVGKSAFSHRHGGADVPAVIAGHTVQLIRPLLKYAVAHGHEVCYLYPTTVAKEDTVLFDPKDKLPEGVRLAPFDDLQFSKTSIHSGWLDFTAALARATNIIKGLDWVILCYGFPFAPLINYIKCEKHFRLAILMRGGDAYKWLDPSWIERQPGMSNAEELRNVYRSSLLGADFLGVASRWLGQQLERHDVGFHAIIESPAACEMPTIDIANRDLLQPEVGIRATFGTMNPEKKWLLTACRASRDKRVDLAIEIFAEAVLPDWQLILSVPGPEHDTIVKKAARLKPGSVCIVVAAPRSVGALFKTCDAYIHTSIPSQEFIDARPSSVTSAAYYGKAVVAPLALDGGLTESLSPENIEAYCFDIRNLHPTRDNNSIVASGAQATYRLADDNLRKSVESTNAEHNKSSSAKRVFERLFAYLKGIQSGNIVTVHNVAREGH